MQEKMKVSTARIDAGFTQHGMAKALNVCVDTYRKWEKNPRKMPLAVAYQFCEVVGREFDAVLFLQ